MERATLWARVGHWLRPSAHPDESDRFPPIAPPIGPIGGEGMATTDAGTIASDTFGTGSKFRLARTTSAIDRLEEEYARVIKIVESVQKHLELQSEWSESMAGSMNRTYWPSSSSTIKCR